MNGIIVFLSITVLYLLFYIVSLGIIHSLLDTHKKITYYICTIIFAIVYIATFVANKEYIFNNPYPNYLL